MPHPVPYVGALAVVAGVARGAYPYARYALLYCCGAQFGGRPGLVVVVHYVHVHAFAAVAAVAAPVVDDVVAQVHALVGLGAGARAESRGARCVVDDEVVVVRRAAAAPVAAEAVGSLGVACVGEARPHYAPLHGAVAVAVDGEALVDAPAHRAVVDDDVLLVAAAEPVALVAVYVAVAQAEAHIAYDDVARAYLEGIVCDADALARRALPGYCHVAVAQAQAALEVNRSGYVEDDCARPFLFACPAEGAFLAGVLKRGYVVDGTAAAAGRIPPEALCPGESGQLFFWLRIGFNEGDGGKCECQYT